MPALRPARPLDGSACLELVEFKITTEPIAGNPLEALPEDIRKRAPQVGQRVANGSAGDIPVLEEWISRFPDCPPLYNFLACAYEAKRDYQEAHRLVEETYRRFPDYLFGMCSYAKLLLERGKLDEVTALLRNRYSLHLWIRNRRVFHVTEFVAFNSLMVEYFSRTPDLELAERYLKMLEQVAPNHEPTQKARSVFEASLDIITGGLARLAGVRWPLRRPRDRRR